MTVETKQKDMGEELLVSSDGKKVKDLSSSQSKVKSSRKKKLRRSSSSSVCSTSSAATSASRSRRVEMRLKRADSLRFVKVGNRKHKKESLGTSEDNSYNSESSTIDVTLGGRKKGPLQLPQEEDGSENSSADPDQIAILMGRVSETPPSRPKLKKRKSSKRLLKGEKQEKKKSSKKKGVSFKANKKGGVRRYVEKFEKCEPEHVWWTPEELGAFRQNCIDVVKRFKEQELYIKALKTLYKAHKASDSKVEKASKVLLEHAEARGLEMHICDGASEAVEEHQASLILSCQSAKATPNAIRKESKVLTKRSSSFAHAMAEFDAQEAAVAYTMP